MHVKVSRWILCIALLITLIYPSQIFADTVQESVQSTVVDHVDPSMKESPIQEKELPLNVEATEKENELIQDKLFVGYDDTNSSEIPKTTVQTLSKMVLDAHPETIDAFQKLHAVLCKDQDPPVKKEEVVNAVITEMISEWNLCPNSTSIGRVMQLVAHKKFGLHGAIIPTYKHKSNDQIENQLHQYDEIIGFVLEAMKEYTGKTLKEQGISELTLFRGVRLPKVLTHPVEALHLRPLSSFSLDYSKVLSFTYPEKGLTSYIMASSFPVDRLLSFGLTGLGTLYEYEFVVLGPEKDLDRFHIIKQDPSEWGEENPKDNGETCAPPKAVKKGKWVDHHKYASKKKSTQNKSLTLAPIDSSKELADNDIQISDVDAVDSSEETPDVPEKGFWAWIKSIAKATKNVFVGIGNWIVSLFS